MAVSERLPASRVLIVNLVVRVSKILRQYISVAIQAIHKLKEFQHLWLFNGVIHFSIPLVPAI
ncbi:hypothetical protein D3C77_460420 [compost metagenome]